MSAQVSLMMQFFDWLLSDPAPARTQQEIQKQWHITDQAARGWLREAERLQLVQIVRTGNGNQIVPLKRLVPAGRHFASLKEGVVPCSSLPSSPGESSPKLQSPALP